MYLSAIKSRPYKNVEIRTELVESVFRKGHKVWTTTIVVGNVSRLKGLCSDVGMEVVFKCHNQICERFILEESINSSKYS